MKIKMTNREIVGTILKLDQFIAKDKETPFKLSYAITKNLKTLWEENKPYEVERQKINAKKTSDASKEKMLKDLLEIENEVEVHSVPSDVCENCGLSAKDILAIEFMFEESAE